MDEDISTKMIIPNHFSIRKMDGHLSNDNYI